MSTLTVFEPPQILWEIPGPAVKLYITRSDQETKEYWNSYKTIEPVPDGVKALVIVDLKNTWHFWREMNFRFLTRKRWISCDNVKIALRDSVGKFDRPSDCLQVCNKPTAFYWLQSAQLTDNTGERTRTHTIVFAAIFQEWLRCYSYMPNMEWDHFFANPVRITATGPSTVRDVLNAHLSLCKQASGLLRIVQQQDPRAKHYAVSRLYRAVVVIIDQLCDWEEEPDGSTSLRKFAQCQTVLIASTGFEEGLSAPISLDSLRSESLPLEPSDVTHHADVVRVSLATAVRFIVSLEKRENPEILKIQSGHDLDIHLCPSSPKGFEGNDEVRRSAEAWADANMIAAEQHGFDNTLDTHTSIRRVQAGLAGQGYHDFIHEPFQENWR